MIRDEIFSKIEKQSQKQLYIALTIFILISSLFIILAGSFDTNPFKLRNEVRNALEIKLSSNDLVSLFNYNSADNWLNVRLISSEPFQSVIRIKIKRTTEYSLDLKLNINGIIYNLNRTGQKGKRIYDFFKTASAWGIETSSPQLVQLKINNVFIGIYMIEEQIYEQIREINGAYFIRLNSDFRLLKRILFQVETGKKGLIRKYFNSSKLAAYLVFFSLFSYQNVLDFNELVFRFDPEKGKFIPYLTMESIISSLKEHNTEFRLPSEKDKHLFTRLNPDNINNLLARVELYKYKNLIKAVLE